MKSVAEILARADAEVSAGRNWRAKEILRGSIASGRVDPAILERYGWLLDSLGDRVEGGKYLFLSGVRVPEYAEAIAVFRRRHAKGRGNALAGLFPAGVRSLRFDELPNALQHDLRELSVDPNAFGNRREPSKPAERRIGERLIIAAALAVLAVFVLALVLGIGVMGKWLLSFFG